MRKKILLTGGSGFIGKNLLEHLYHFNNYSVVRTSRNRDEVAGDNYFIPFIDSKTEWSSVLPDVDCVIHLAGLAHEKNTSNNLNFPCSYREINTEGTLNLARQAAGAGVKRFIFISSIGVSGITTAIDEPFKSSDIPTPQEPYAISKYEAEVGLRLLAQETGLELVIIRPPLVYGAGAPGNFGKLVDLVKKNLPLPFGAINNQRSLVGIDNLVDLISICIVHKNAKNQTFLVSDDQDISTSQLLTAMIRCTGKKSCLVPVPVNFLKFFAWLLGKKSVVDKVCNNLQLDISHTKSTLSWKPPVSFTDGIRRCFNE
jgi:nucleoside-diphosphate-sugar epimerase